MVFEGAGSLNPSGTSRGGFGRVLPRDFADMWGIWPLALACEAF